MPPCTVHCNTNRYVYAAGLLEEPTLYKDKKIRPPARISSKILHEKPLIFLLGLKKKITLLNEYVMEYSLLLSQSVKIFSSKYLSGTPVTTLLVFTGTAWDGDPAMTMLVARAYTMLWQRRVFEC